MRARGRDETKVLVATFLLVVYGLALSMASPVMSPVQFNETISNTGSITAVGVGIYWNQEGTNRVTSIDWGTLEPDSNTSVTVYIKNEENSAVTLGLYTSNWNPSNTSDYVSLTWDYGGQFINAEEIVQVTLMLSVSADISGITTFSFDITIIAST